jgi:membrane protein YqaA with SNARE-associated domain
LFHALRRLGGPGLIVLGVVDNSAIPVPGSMDVFTIVLAASHKDLWWYYALMATIGSLLGGYITYRLGMKGGKELLEKRISARRAQKVYQIFGRYGFWSVAVGAISPPPVPIVPFLIAAGSMRYPREKFLVALALGRGVRYALVAYLGSIYGSQIIRWMGGYYEPILYFLIFLAIAGGIFALLLWLRHRRSPARKSSRRLSSHKAA